MPKFEYAEMEVTLRGVFMDTTCEFVIYDVDGHDQHNSGRFGHILALAGEQGWEVVSSTVRTQPVLNSVRIINYILKREKVEAAKAT